MIEIPEITKEILFRLKTDPTNPNVMTKEQIQSVANSIKKYGFLIPIIVNKDNVIIDGHQRKIAAEHLGMDEVPVIRLNVDKVDQKLLKQIMNKLKGHHDYELDLEEYRVILEQQGNLDDLKKFVAMDDEYINNILNELNPQKHTLEELDEVPEIEGIKTDIKLGDMFKLGEHYILCGDSTKKEDVDRLMQGNKADMVFTDPPYNLNFAGTTHKFKNFANDNLNKTNFEIFLTKSIKRILENTKESTSYYVCIDYRNYPLFYNTIEAEGLEIINCIVWDKVFAGMGYKYRFRHEFIIFAGIRDKIVWNGSTVSEDVISTAVEKGKDGIPLDLRGFLIPVGEQFIRVKLEKEKLKRVPILESTENKFVIKQGTKEDIWQGYSMNSFAQRDYEISEGMVHPTMKPVRMIMDFIENSSNYKNIILDSFLGSGSTLIAAEATKRVCYGLELDPAYCEVICQRWEKLTGQKREKVS